MITSYHITCSFLVFCTVCKIASTNQNTSCVMPETPVNGKVFIDRKGRTTSAVYSCDTGYTLTGNKSRICGSNGEWEGSAPICSLDTKEEKSSSNQITEIIGVFVFFGVFFFIVILVAIYYNQGTCIRDCLPNLTLNCTTCCPRQCQCQCCGFDNANSAIPGNTNTGDRSSQQTPPALVDRQVLSQQTSAGLLDRQASFIDLAPLDRNSKLRHTVC